VPIAKKKSDILSSSNMCHWDRVIYHCGCIKRTEFSQCAKWKGSNVKCKPITDGKPKAADHLCVSHLVNPDAAQKFYLNDKGEYVCGPIEGGGGRWSELTLSMSGE